VTPLQARCGPEGG